MSQNTKNVPVEELNCEIGKIGNSLYELVFGIREECVAYVSSSDLILAIVGFRIIPLLVFVTIVWFVVKFLRRSES